MISLISGKPGNGKYADSLKTLKDFEKLPNTDDIWYHKETRIPIEVHAFSHGCCVVAHYVTKTPHYPIIINYDEFMANYIFFKKGINGRIDSLRTLRRVALPRLATQSGLHLSTQSEGISCKHQP